MERRVIAVIEDNEDNRILLQALIGDSYVLRQYASGPEALVGMERETPELVLLDISLPGMDGVSVLQHMRRTNALATLPVIALTAHAMAGDRERLLAAGFDGYVSKPIVDERQLVALIEELLHRPLRS
jgi:CheY-like chemotaxis protein